MISIERQIEQARNKLLDLTLRNRLINYRVSKTRTIPIFEGNIPDIYETLVLKEKHLTFRQKAAIPNVQKIQSSLIKDSTEKPIVIQEIPIESKLSSNNKEVDTTKTHLTFLKTSLENEVLEKRLFYIFQQSKQVLEEQGYTVLFLALGFLEWKEREDSEKILKSPLLLIPVIIERGGVHSNFTISWSNDEIISNISLQEKLKGLGITLPDFEMPEDKNDLNNYFEAVKNSISKHPDWEITDEAYLDFFSFTKFVMYKDLDGAIWPEGKGPAHHTLITTIFDLTPDNSLGSGFNEEEVDQKISTKDVYHILDADSSQISVIEDIKSGRNLVVEGPPGTGKSQTIANAIAELLAEGKSVLFISEKMAALEVVKKRLDLVGLGDFCLALHSRKSNKKVVLNELKRTVSQSPPPLTNLDYHIANLEQLKQELNGYLSSLYKPIGARGLTPFELIGLNEQARNHFSRFKRKIPRLAIPNADKIDNNLWGLNDVFLKKMVDILPLVSPISDNPWRDTSPGLVLQRDIEIIETLIADCLSALSDLKSKMVILVEVSGISEPTNFRDISNSIGATSLFISSNPVDRNILLNEQWNGPNQNVDFLCQQILQYRYLREKTIEIFKKKILENNVDILIEEFQPLSEKFVLIKIFSSHYKQKKSEILLFYKDNQNKSDQTILKDLKLASKCIAFRKRVRDAEAKGRDLFGSLWLNEESETEKLQSFSKWIIEFRRQILQDVFTERTVEMVSRGIAPDKIEQSAKNVEQTYQICISRLTSLFNRLQFNYNQRLGPDLNLIDLEVLPALLTDWKKNVHRLMAWNRYLLTIKDPVEPSSTFLNELVAEGALFPEDILPAFNANYSDILLRHAFSERNELSNFDGIHHEKKIREFIDLDKKIIEGNRLRLSWKLWEQMPKLSEGASKGSEAGILQGEFNRQRNHLPIRKLMAYCGGLIQKIKPCFMMSPLSVAQFLDPKTVKFDVILFDEASQVKPEDALGALLRGNQAVVMGDSRQLPPTSFFDKMSESDDETDELDISTSDMESILNLCKSGFPTKTLRWHYRSRHESLISLSNSAFYNNRLLVYPSPMAKSENLGLKFVYLPENKYDRGKSSENRGEARSVANAIFEHYLSYPDKSLGIGTFNIKQQQAILEEIDLILKDHPDWENFTKMHIGEELFVKNLETIQGDERDVIFLSIGYGKDNDGKLSLNFGPLNQEGGERRLNVLITRAREKCVVFSNFTSRDLSVTDNSAIGVKVLKQFLEYAETGNLPRSFESGGDFDSPFEESVFDYLCSSGFQVHKQVGCAGFRIDLALVDPVEPGRYFLGIECDGAQYHSSRVARDRDRLRQQILEGLGWSIYRIWSTDWFQNIAETQQRLLQEITARKNAPKSEPKLPSKNLSQINLPKSDEAKIKIETRLSWEQELEKCGQIYSKFSSSAINLNYVGSEFSSLDLINIIEKIVDHEGPIHLDEVIQRIREIFSVSRMGSRMKEQILLDISRAHGLNRITKKGQFLWPIHHSRHVLRHRPDHIKVDINFICDEEIVEAIKFVLSKQFATDLSNLIHQALRVLGVRSSRQAAFERVTSIIDTLLKSKILVKLANGMIDLSK